MIIIDGFRGRGFLFGLFCPSGGPLFAAVSGFRLGGSSYITATLDGSCGLLVGFLIHFTEGFIIQRDFLVVNSQPPTAKDHFRGFERQHPFIIVRNDTGNQINHTGNLICYFILKVRLDRTYLIAALSGQIPASVLMADQDDIFIIKAHQPLQGVQEFASDHIPSPERIIRFMLPALTVTDVNPAGFIDIFQQINHNGFEVILLLFQFSHGFHEHFIGQLPFGQPAFHGHHIPDGNVRGIHKLDIAIRVQHQRIRELVGKEGLAAEGCAIQPNNLLFGGVQITPFIFGK